MTTLTLFSFLPKTKLGQIFLYEIYFFLKYVMFFDLDKKNLDLRNKQNILKWWIYAWTKEEPSLKKISSCQQLKLNLDLNSWPDWFLWTEVCSNERSWFLKLTILSLQIFCNLKFQNQFCIKPRVVVKTSRIFCLANNVPTLVQNISTTTMLPYCC